jgi:hypothetical protein
MCLGSGARIAIGRIDDFGTLMCSTAIGWSAENWSIARCFS